MVCWNAKLPNPCTALVWANYKNYFENKKIFSFYETVDLTPICELESRFRIPLSYERIYREKSALLMAHLDYIFYEILVKIP